MVGDCSMCWVSLLSLCCMCLFVGFAVIVVGKGRGLDPLVGVGVVWCAGCCRVFYWCLFVVFVSIGCGGEGLKFFSHLWREG